MKVSELIEQLQALGQPDLEVWIAKDAEGNGFKPLDELQIYPMMDNEVIADEDAEEHIEDGDTVDYRVVLWP